jgi:hypothetical protein
MKQSPQLDRIQHEMHPGAIVRDGFLGTDARKLAEVLDADAAAVRRLGVSHGAIAARMRELSRAGERGLGQDVDVGGVFEVRVDSVRGKLPCPFGHEGLYSKKNTTVRRADTGEELTFTDLGVHMIEAHGFYEGKGSPFRVDPVSAVRILEVAAAD